MNIYYSILYFLLSCLFFGLVSSKTYPSEVYTGISDVDYSYLKNVQGVVPGKMTIFGHYSRSETPKYTVIFFHGYITPKKLLEHYSKKFYVRMVRHLDYYNQEFSDNVQFIVPDWIPIYEKVIASLGLAGFRALQAGKPPLEPYLWAVLSGVAFINNLYRRGIIPHLNKSSLYGNCVGGSLSIGITLLMKKPLGVTVVNGGALILADELASRYGRRKKLKTEVLLIHGTGDTMVNVSLARQSYFKLKSWGEDPTLYLVDGNHFDVMVKHLYTGFRFIASRLTNQPDIFRPGDSDNLELIQMTKLKVNKTEIVPIVNSTNSTNSTILQMIIMIDSETSSNLE